MRFWRDIFSYFIKVSGITYFLLALLILAVMIRFGISLDFVFHGSDAAIEAELAQFLDPKSFAADIIDALPFSLIKILEPFEFTKDIVQVLTSMGVDVDNAQKQLFESITSVMFSFLIFELIMFVYKSIRKFAHWAGRNGFFSWVGEIIAILQMAYIGAIIVILMRDFAMQRIYAKGPVFMFVFICLLLIAIRALYVLCFKNRKVADQVADLAKSVLFTASSLWMSISLSVLLVLSENADLSIFVIINCVISLIAVSILGSIKFADCFGKIGQKSSSD